MSSLIRPSRTALTALALCALALVGIVPTSAADMLDPQLKASYEFTIHKEETVDLTATMTAAGLSDDNFSQFCKKENFPTFEGATPDTVEQIEQDGKPACRISVANLSPDEMSSVTWSVTHEDGRFTFSATTYADLDDTTMTVNFPTRVAQANADGTINGSSVTWTGLASNTAIEATAKDSSGPPWMWIIAGVAAVIVVGGGAALANVLRSRGRKPGGRLNQ